MGASPIGFVVVTAADRAAATYQRWLPTDFRWGAGEGFQRAIAKPPDGLRPLVVPEGHETVTCGGFAATPRLLPQKEGDHPRQRMVEDIPLRCGNMLPSNEAYPQSALRLTAPSAEGAFCRRFLQSLP